MRGRILAFSVAAVLMTAAMWGRALADGEKKGQACPMKSGAAMSCPMMVEGAETQLANVQNGVTITITAKDPEAIKKIQEAAASHMKDGKFSCCGKCGMKKGHKCDMHGKKGAGKSK